MPHLKVVVVGGGPAGLMSAEVLARSGAEVVLHERMPTLGRKFLMAGRGGLNLTHSEPFEDFAGRYGAANGPLRPILEAFPPQALMAWAEALGQPIFTGSSGRVFPKALKASPLLRAWLARLVDLGVTIRTRSAWRGWDEDGGLVFEGEARSQRPDRVILALGGASWPRLGSDGGWAPILADRGVPLTPFRPANSGFDVSWSQVFRARFAGEPLKAVALTFAGRTVRGEAMIAAYGLEGGAIYALSAGLREALARSGQARLEIDLRPDISEAQLAARLGKARPGESLANRLRKALRLSPVEINLLREVHGEALPTDPAGLARAIKVAPIRLDAVRPLDRAISTAGGVAWSGVDADLMLKALPGVHVAGEMLDWEAPTGGYLLQACFASGVRAANSLLERAGEN